MLRSLNNQRCLFLLSALTAALLWLAPVRSARAAVYTYNARQRVINAGVLFVGSAAYPPTDAYAPDPAPYVFYVLDQRPDVKPVGWRFVNPLAQSTVSTAMSSRWAPAYKAGDSLNPSMAAYWEVALRDVSADDLQQFDVLYLHASSANYSSAFLPADNEKLRRFVDGGGQLIVEYGGLANALSLFGDATWTSANDANVTLVFQPGSLLTQHPIVSQPYPLWSVDPHYPFLLGTANSGGFYGTITNIDISDDYANLFGAVLYRTATTGAAFATPTGPAVSAAQLGAGQLIVSALDVGVTVSRTQAAFFSTPAAPNDPAAAPLGDLKFLSNTISWADTHPTENKTSHQNAAGPSAASFAPAWAYPDPASGKTLTGMAPPGAAVWGNFVFVTDSTGTLHAFDAYPDQDLTGKGSADLGTAPPVPYGEIWNTGVISSPASAPTVANYGGQTLVLVEDNKGVVHVYIAATGAAFSPAALSAPGANPGIFASPIPAPTYYDGRVYAGQADGTLLVYSLNGFGSAGSGVIIPVNPTTLSGEYVTASPAVGILSGGTVTNTIVALVPTTENMNTVLLGARNDPLTPFSPNGQFAGYNVNRGGRYSLFNLFVDPASRRLGRAFDSNGNNQNGVVNPPFFVSGGQDPVFATTIPPANPDDFFGDWDVDFRASTGQNNNGPSNGTTLTLHEIKALSIANTAGGGATLSAPAIDRKGDYYYVVNAGADSYLFGVHDDIQQRNVRIKFRFRLPKTGDASTIDPTVNGGTNWSTPGYAVDADNVNYANTSTNPADGSSRSLLDYHFVGAPVVDGQGNVYVAAQNGLTGPAAVLSFSADKEVTASPSGNAAIGFDAVQSRYYQIDESAGNQQNPLVAVPSPGRGAGRYGQITTAGNLASVFNFGRGSGGSRQIAGNLCEPQPFTAIPSGPSGGTAAWMYFHTNLNWYATFAVNGQVSGLSKAGSTLLLCDSGNGTTPYNILYKLPAAPTVGAGKLAALTVRKSPLGTAASGTFLNVGAVTAAPSAGGGAMVVNGALGIAAFTQQLTLIADNNRILEVDADGNAVWSSDATTRAGVNGSSTKVDFAHPSALAQFAPNDYLVADTGNNRCVRFDRGGGVIWELTHFYDPSALLAPGQSRTLSQPTSVEVRREALFYSDPVSQKQLTGQLVHYLIADSGNDRIVEVTDTLDASGNVLYFDLNGTVVLPGASGSVTHDHLLTWVTHTGDKYGRRYRYAGASYLDIPGAPDTIEVFALVTNTRVAQTAGGQLAPASADAPGGSIIAFNRPASPKPYSLLGPTDTDISYVTTSFTATTTTGTVTFPVRNPRFLHVFAPPQAAPVTPDKYAYSFLYADGNGAFDLVYTGQATPPVSYGLAFTQTDYRNMSLSSPSAPNGVSADLPGNLPLRNGAPVNGNIPAVPPIPFVPTCVQRLNNDATNVPGINHIERYLITQSYSQGELARLPGSKAATRLGGEIFEVDVSTTAAGIPTIDPVGGFAGAVTLSRPVGAGPLTQPTFAIRTTQ